MKDHTFAFLASTVLLLVLAAAGGLGVRSGEPWAWLMVGLSALAMLVNYRNWRRAAWWENRCCHCMKVCEPEKLIKIVHGMGPESDSWVEAICLDCQTPENTSGGLTRHRVQ